MTYYNTNNTNTNNMKTNKHNHQTDKPLVRPSNIVPRHPSKLTGR
jgi:hypothetical protein